ncbi:MAG: carbon storage regulator CsrA [Spirochaetia bacterium]|nr:carbon storage regulator CsrA [Spirochaetia bacterium]
MLILARKTNESIIINDNIEILIVDVKGDQVKVGIKAPRDVRVYRGEIYAEIQKENIEASKSELPKDIQNLLKKKGQNKKSPDDK